MHCIATQERSQLWIAPKFKLHYPLYRQWQPDLMAFSIHMNHLFLLHLQYHSRSFLFWNIIGLYNIYQNLPVQSFLGSKLSVFPLVSCWSPSLSSGWDFLETTRNFEEISGRALIKLGVWYKPKFIKLN